MVLGLVCRMWRTGLALRVQDLPQSGARCCARTCKSWTRASPALLVLSRPAAHDQSS
jgi:hypothetical protein